MDLIPNQGKNIEHVYIAPDVDMCGVMTKEYTPKQWLNIDVKNNVPLSGHFILKYLRGAIDGFLVDYTVQSTGEKISNLPLSNFIYLVRHGTLPDIDIESNVVEGKTVREVIMSEFDIMGYNYVKPSPWQPA